jgi:Domain of unknown function (DUF4424)
MTSEDLYLSPLEVRVSYVFLNLTDHDVSGTVAFPLPEIPVSDMSESPHEFHKSSMDGDIFDFHVEAGGRLVKPEADIHASVKGPDGIEKDVTGLLKKYHLPAVDPEPAYGALDANAIKALVTAGVLTDDGDHYPLWSVRTTFHWQQIFPAGKNILITHRYKPVPGGDFHFTKTTQDGGKYLEPWCPDRPFVESVKALPADEDAMLLDRRLEYILKTGANWAGPISRFRLEIDKAGADLVSLCPIPGLKLQRRGQSFVAEASQYVPTTDIKLLFVYRACDKAPCGLNPSWPGYRRN